MLTSFKSPHCEYVGSSSNVGAAGTTLLDGDKEESKSSTTFYSADEPANLQLYRGKTQAEAVGIRENPSFCKDMESPRDENEQPEEVVNDSLLL